MIRSIESEEEGMFSPVNEKGTPERNLLMGILERAILDFVGNEPKEVEAANEWIFECNNSMEHFSFPWVCTELDLDPVRISRIIKEMPKRGVKKIAPWYQMKKAA